MRCKHCYPVPILAQLLGGMAGAVQQHAGGDGDDVAHHHGCLAVGARHRALRLHPHRRHRRQRRLYVRRLLVLQTGLQENLPQLLQVLALYVRQPPDLAARQLLGDFPIQVRQLQQRRRALHRALIRPRVAPLCQGYRLDKVLQELYGGHRGGQPPAAVGRAWDVGQVHQSLRQRRRHLGHVQPVLVQGGVDGFTLQVGQQQHIGLDAAGLALPERLLLPDVRVCPEGVLAELLHGGQLGGQQGHADVLHCDGQCLQDARQPLALPQPTWRHEEVVVGLLHDAVGAELVGAEQVAGGHPQRQQHPAEHQRSQQQRRGPAVAVEQPLGQPDPHRNGLAAVRVAMLLPILLRVGIRERLVCLGDGFCKVLRSRWIRVLVRMILQRQLAVRALNVRRGGTLL
mmetsp:Transcript_12528/g.37598  ORF Transcript_12528/g.37598 Transcript_12528/m.37598 type:complete len:399 (+) Transcript_12528:1948-3144(+)